MVLRGLTLPNRQWEPWTPAEVQALFDLEPDAVLVLLYDVGHPAARAHREVLVEYLRIHPQTRILYRPYGDAILLHPAVSWAEECDRRLDFFRLPGELTPANEMNLTIEHGSEDWDAQIRWLDAFLRRFRQLSIAPVHLPALSPSGRYRDGLLRYRNAGIHQAFNVADAHCYPGSLDDWQLIARLFGLPVSITEYNQVDPASYLATLDGRVRDAVWFLLSGTEDQRPYFLISSPYYESFKRRVPMPPTQPTNPNPVGPGVAAKLKEQGDVARSPEQYLGEQLSITFGDRGIYVYSKHANRTYFLPAR